MDHSTTSESEPDDRTEGTVWRRRLLIGLAAAVALLVGAGVAAKVIFTPEKLTSMVVPRLEEAAGRDVQVSTVKLDLLPRPSVRLEDVSLAAAPGFGPEPALTGEAVDLQIAILPLFLGQVVPTRLRLVAPTVRYLVAPDGSHSFSGLGGDPAEDAPGAGEEAEDETTLPVSDFAVERGTVLYDDRREDRGARFGTEGTFTASLDDGTPPVISSRGDLRIDSLRAMLPELRDDSLRIEAFRLTYDGRLVPGADSLDLRRIGLEVDEVELSGDGSLAWGGETPRASLRFETGETDLAALRRMAPRLDLGGLNPRGTLRLTARVEGWPGGDAPPEVEGDAQIRGLALAYSGRDEFVSDVDGELSFTRTSARVSSLEGELMGRDVRMEGTVADFDSLRADLELEGEGDLEQLAAVLPEETAGGAVTRFDPRGDLRFSLRVQGPLRGEGTPDVGGEAQVSGFGAGYPDVGDVIDGASAAMTFAGDSVRVSSFEGSVLGRPLRGQAVLVRGDPHRVEGQVDGEIDLERLSRTRARLAEDAGDPDADVPRPMSGTAAVDLTFRGTTDDLPGLTVRGPVRLSDVSYETPSLAAPLEIASGTVRFTGSGVETRELGMRVGATDLALTADARDVLPLSRLDRDRRGEGPRPTLEFRLASDRVQLDQLFPERPGGDTDPTYSEVLKAHLSGQQVDGRPPEDFAGDRYPLPDLPELDARGEVEVGELVNPPTRLEDLTFSVALEDRSLRVRDVQAGLYGGRLTGEVSADVGTDDRRSPVRFDMDLQGSDAAAFMDRWTKLENALTGTLDISIAGRTLFDQILLPVTEQTDAKGRLTVRDGSMEGMVPMQGVVRAVGLSAAEIARFDSLGGPFRVREGRLELLDWTMDNPSGAAGQMSGTVAFAGPLDLDMTLSVPPSMLQGSRLMQLVGGEGVLGKFLGGAAGEDEIIDVPISVGGTMSEPAVQVNERAVAAGLRSLLKSRGGARGLLEDLLGGDEDDEDGEEDGGGLLERLLEGRKDTTSGDDDGGGR